MNGQIKHREHNFAVVTGAPGNAVAAENEKTGNAMPQMRYVDISHCQYRHLKRLGDIVGSLFMLLILSVPFALIALLIFIDDPGPILFRQYRVGLNGKQFKLCKFRSMKVHAPQYTSTAELTNSRAYITRIGRLLRKFSIDELPQLINVLFGDMSLVGPRPLIPNEHEIHKMRMQCGVYNVRPGMTGLAQINGRDTVAAVDKVCWDVKYLQSFGLKADIQILLSTIPKVLRALGVVEGNHHNVR